MRYFQTMVPPKSVASNTPDRSRSSGGFVIRTSTVNIYVLGYPNWNIRESSNVLCVFYALFCTYFVQLFSESIKPLVRVRVCQGS